MTDARSELRAAVGEIRTAYAALTFEAQSRVEIRRDGLDQELDRAFAADDAERARAAVRAWRGWWLAVIERAAHG